MLEIPTFVGSKCISTCSTHRTTKKRLMGITYEKRYNDAIL